MDVYYILAVLFNRMAMADSNNSSPPASRRREKPQLSCTLCRRRKLRCDRRQPCETCVRRGLSLSCTYVRPPSAAPERIDRAQGRPAGVENLPERIGQLERLITTLMDTVHAGRTPSAKEPMPSDSTAAGFEGAAAAAGAAAPATAPGEAVNAADSAAREEAPQLSDRFGRIKIEKMETAYVESTHWTAILDGIAELRDHFREEQNPVDSAPFQGPGAAAEPTEPDEPDILFGSYRCVSREEILSAMLPRPLVDRLVTEYFINKDIAPVIVHSVAFLREYERFWEHPRETPIMWIGLLFGVMCLGAAFQRQRSSQMPDPQQLVRLYRERIIQCLVVGKYAKCAPYTLETLLLYLNIESLQSEDTRVETWILLGVIVRLALRMGYHRDASHFPHISPFAAEMRRRVWALIVQFDCLTSAQVGLPRMIRDSQSDTAEPRNLLDEDFDEDSTALPLPQPSTVQTPVQYIVAKNRIVAVFGRICDLITSSRAPSYTEVMQLDETLHETYRCVPGGLQMRPMTRSLTDGATVILRRMYIVLLYHKAVCMLHHRYMVPARTDGRYAYSRSTCVAAALQIVSHQWTLHNEAQPGGRLYEERWKVSSLVKSTFFLGTTILCAELDCSLHKEPADAEQSPAETGLRQQVIQALHNSHTIWRQASDSSREARLAADVSGLLLTRAQRKWKLEMRQAGNMGMSSETPFMGVSIPPQSTTMAAAAVAQPLSMPQLLQFNTAAHIDYSDVGAEPLGLSQGVDDMLAMSMTFPRMFNVPV